MNVVQVPAYFKDSFFVNSVADLFALYGRLVQPVREYEETAQRRDKAMEELEQARNTVSSAWVMPFLQGISRALLLAIPFVIFFLILCNVKTNAEGVKWLTLYDVWYGKLWLVEQFQNIISPENVPMWVGIPLTFLHYLLIENVIAPVIFFLLPITIVISVFTTIITVIGAKRTIVIKRQEIARLQAELDMRIDDLDAPLSFVPPDYRSSMALEYFYRGFANGKFHSLQEATAAFDTYLHQQRMEQGQQNMLEAQDNILRQIVYQTAEISKLKGKMDSIKNKVDWL